MIFAVRNAPAALLIAWSCSACVPLFRVHAYPFEIAPDRLLAPPNRASAAL